MLKLSIIIPYYNTYNLTIKLLEQLRIQKTDEVEIILVDDGCHETRFDQYNFITVIHNETNLNAPRSWNIGLNKAQGKYIAFIDSDDMIMPYYIEELIKAIDDNLADEIKFGWMDMNTNRVVTEPRNIAIWKAIYRKEICPYFHEDWTYQSDVPFQQDLSKIKHTQALIPKVLYCYNSRRVGGLTWLRVKEGKRNERKK